MARRKARISLGFGSGGRAGLLGSMLPTPSSNADAMRAIEIQVQSKLDQFKNGQINYAQLEAFINEQMGKVDSASGKASLAANLDAAKTFEIKQKENKAKNSAIEAYNDYINGNGSLAAAQEAIKAAKESIQDSDVRTQLSKLSDNLIQTSFKREVTAKVQGYNDGSVKYDELQKYLKEAVKNTTNTELANQITKAMDNARVAENTTQLNRLSEQYKSGAIGIEAFVSRLAQVRDAADQKDPDQIQKFNAAIAAGEINEQATIDQRKYTDWQTHKISDADAMSYFNGRMAVAKDKQSIDTLGRYAANIQSKQDQANAAAQRNQASVSRQAGLAADAELKRTDSQADKDWKEFDGKGGTMEDLLKAAGSDPKAISEAFAVRKQFLLALAKGAGYNGSVYKNYADQNDLKGRGYIADQIRKDYAKDIADIQIKNMGSGGGDTRDKGDTGPDGGKEGGKIPLDKFISNNIALAKRHEEVLNGKYSNWTTEEDKNDARRRMNERYALNAARIEDDMRLADQARGEVATQIEANYNRSDDKKLAAVMGWTPPAGSKAKRPTLDEYSAWLNSDVRKNAGLAFNALRSTKGQDADGYKGTQDEEAFVNKLVLAIRASDYGSKGGEGGIGSTGIEKAIQDHIRAVYPNGYAAMGIDKYVTNGKDAASQVSQMRASILLGKAFEQPFMGAELPSGPGSPTDPRTGKPAASLLLDNTGVPLGPRYQPIAITEVPTVGEDGIPLTPKQRAITALRLAMGDNFSNAGAFYKTSGDWLGNHIGEVFKGIGTAARKDWTDYETEFKGSDKFLANIWDTYIHPHMVVQNTFDKQAGAEVLRSIADSAGRNLDSNVAATGAALDNLGSAVAATGERFDSSAKETGKNVGDFFDKLGTGLATAGGQFDSDAAKLGNDIGGAFDATGKKFRSVADSVGEAIPQVKLDTTSWEGIWNNVVHSWEQTVGMFGGVIGGEPPTAALPPGDTRDSFLQDLIRQSEEAGFKLNLPDQQQWDIPTIDMTPVDNWTAAPIENSPEDFSMPTPPPTWDSGWNQGYEGDTTGETHGN